MSTFSVYPETFFSGSVRVLLFALIPAPHSGLFSTRLAAQLSLGRFAAVLGGPACVVSVAFVLFAQRLHGYESENPIGASC
ncbi:MAG: hypothetical protein ABI627_07370 [Polyangiaceae bacterium]